MADGDAYRSNHVAAGEIKGTGSAITVYVGFKPMIIRVKNRTQASKGEWSYPMLDATCFKTVTAGTFTYSGGNGITPTYNGFVLGADADLNANNDVIYWEAEK